MPAQDALALANKAAEDAAAVRSKLEPATTDQDADHFCDPPLQLISDDEAPTVKADQVELAERPLQAENCRSAGNRF